MHSLTHTTYIFCPPRPPPASNKIARYQMHACLLHIRRIFRVLVFSRNLVDPHEAILDTQLLHLRVHGRLDLGLGQLSLEQEVDDLVADAVQLLLRIVLVAQLPQLLLKRRAVAL